MGIKFTDLYSKKQPKKKQMPKKLVYTMLAFARDNHFCLHPFGVEKYVDNYQTFGHCACDKSRPACPCPEAIEEVKADGFCKCRFYWKDIDTFMKVQGWEKKQEGEGLPPLTVCQSD